MGKKLEPEKIELVEIQESKKVIELKNGEVLVIPVVNGAELNSEQFITNETTAERHYSANEKWKVIKKK